jgi:hypothetical protein
MKKFFSFLLIVLVFAAVGFGTYQLVFDTAEAGMFSCGSTGGCFLIGDECNGSIKCWCDEFVPGMGFICTLVEPSPNQ